MSQYPPKRSRNSQLALQLASKLHTWHAPKPTETSQKDHPPLTVVCISDTHDQTIPLPAGDLLLHSGDLTEKGTFSQLQAQLDWLNEQPHEHKVVIGGNHDLLLDSTFPTNSGTDSEPGKSRADLVWGSITYLEASSTELTFANGRKLKIYGSPFTPAFGNFAFQYPRARKGTEDANASFWEGKIPRDADVVLTHGPPMFHLDANEYGGHVGCDSLLAELYRAKPRLVVCGHIHEGAGEEILTYDAVQQGFEAALRSKATTGTLAKMMVGAALPAPEIKRCTRLVNAAVMRRNFATEGLGQAVVVKL